VFSKRKHKLKNNKMRGKEKSGISSELILNKSDFITD
jgi:hypothetical protein